MDEIFNVLIKAAAFVLVIAIGYIFKKRGIFNKNDFRLLSTIILKITLPCAIVYNFSMLDMDFSLLLIILLGFLANIILLGAGYVIDLRKSSDEKAFDMVNLSGYNIGNFSIPFVQSFLGPVGFATISMFDAGNSIICLGTNYTLASAVMNGNSKLSFKSIFKNIFSSVPFDTYLVMITLQLLNIKLPALAVSFTQTVGGANAFLALLMIGIGFEIYFDKEHMQKIFKLVLVRYSLALVFSLTAFFLLPFPLEVRQALAIVSFGPVAAVTTAFTEKLGLDVELSSAVNSIDIVISVILMTLVLLLVV